MKTFLGLFLFLGLVNFARPIMAEQVINVDFQPGAAGGVSAAGYSGQGVLNDPGNNTWNVLAPDTDGAFNGTFGSGGPLSFVGSEYTVSGLLDSSGAATPVSVTVFKGDPEAAFAVVSTNGSIVDIATNAVDLMRDYLIAQDDASYVVISNLTAGGIYNLVLFGAGDLDFRNTTFIVGEQSKTTTGIPLGPHGLTEGQDYVRFNGVVADGGMIRIEYLTGGESTDGNFNGFQLVAADPVAISTVKVAAVTGLSFDSVSNAEYRLQFTDNLVSTNWQTAPVLMYGTGGAMTAFDPTGFSTNRSYRIYQQ